MPLLDHFHPPVAPDHHWESFHSNWATRIADALNEILPEEFLAEEFTHSGARLELDVATYESTGAAVVFGDRRTATATVAAVWTPPAATCTIPAVFADTFEVRVFQTTAGRTLVAAVELVSPGKQGPCGRAAGLCRKVRELSVAGRERGRRGHRDEPPGEPAR